uniref:Uncharacterized protein n=1 Tax=Tanacetum cinerariifolium TaxID=118510 RepID=A0A6L2M5N7_TANCI|nr:hypothetical protein [Tanacetum cinerariifolium]
MGYLVYAYYGISPTRYYKDDSCWSADLKSKATKDIIGVGSFMEVLILSHYVLVRKILNDDFRVELGLRVLEEEVVPKVDDVSLVEGVFDGAFGGDGEEDVVIGEGVVVASSSLEMLTKSHIGEGVLAREVLSSFPSSSSSLRREEDGRPKAKEEEVE